MIDPQSEVTYWGALGNADSTAAFQQCADWCGEHGQPFVVPDTVLPYLLSDTVHFRTVRQLAPFDNVPPSDTHFSDCLPFEIVGHGSAKVRAAASMPSMFELAYNAGLSNMGPFYSSIINLSMDGGGLATACIKSDWVMHCGVERSRLFNAERGYEVQGFGVFRAKGNVIRCKSGFYMLGTGAGGGDSLIDACDFYLAENYASGVYMGYYSGNTTIRDCTMTGDGVFTDTVGVRAVGASAPASEHIRNVTVSGNEFHGLGTGVALTGKSSAIKNVFQARLDGNHVFTGDSTAGRLLSATDCREIMVTDNFINGKDFATATLSGVSLNRCEDAVVRGNIASNLNSAAVTMTDCTDSEVFDNKVRDYGKLGAGYTAIDIWGSLSRRNQVRRNTVIQSNPAWGQSGIVEHAGVDKTYMIDNSIYGCTTPVVKVGANSVYTAGV